MIPILANSTTSGGAREGASGVAPLAQGNENKEVFGNILRAATAAEAGAETPANSTESALLGAGLEEGNGLPASGNGLPGLPGFAVPKESLEVVAPAAPVDSVVPGPDANGLYPAADLSEAVSAEIAPVLQAPAAPSDTPVDTNLLPGEVELAELTAPGVASPAAVSHSTPAAEAELTAVITAGAFEEAVLPSGPATAVPASPLGTQQPTLSEVDLVAPPGREALMTADIEVRKAPTTAASNVAASADAVVASAQNNLRSTGFSNSDQMQLSVADEVVLETGDGFFGIDPGRSKPASVTIQAQPLLGLTPPAAAEPSAATAKPVSLPPLSAPPGDPEWGGELAGRISMMVKSGSQEASLQINPPELGRLDIRITTEGDQARVQFAVHNAEAREVIEQNMPRLREMLEQGGLQLARGDVADHSQSDRQSGEAHGAGPGTDAQDTDAGELSQPIMQPRMSDSRVDYYV